LNLLLVHRSGRYKEKKLDIEGEEGWELISVVVGAPHALLWESFF